MRRFVRTVVATCGVMLCGIAAFAGAPAPSATPTVSPTPTLPVMNTDLSGTTVRWTAILDAASYHLTGTFEAKTTNRQGPCVAPNQRDERVLTVDETVASPSNSFELPLPRLTDDEWVVSSLTGFTVAALVQQGGVIASVSAQRVVEGCQIPLATATPQPAVALPNTGAGTSPDGNARLLTLAAFGLTMAATCVMALIWARRERYRK